jgi:hypothetical protein
MLGDFWEAEWLAASQKGLSYNLFINVKLGLFIDREAIDSAWFIHKWLTDVNQK